MERKEIEKELKEWQDKIVQLEKDLVEDRTTLADPDDLFENINTYYLHVQDEIHKNYPEDEAFQLKLETIKSHSDNVEKLLQMRTELR